MCPPIGGDLTPHLVGPEVIFWTSQTCRSGLLRGGLADLLVWEDAFFSEHKCLQISLCVLTDLPLFWVSVHALPSQPGLFVLFLIEEVAGVTSRVTEASPPWQGKYTNLSVGVGLKMRNGIEVTCPSLWCWCIYVKSRKVKKENEA